MSIKMKESVLAKLFILLGIIIVFIFVLALGFVGWLSVREYKPAQKQEIQILGKGNKIISVDDSFTLITFNIGYGGLDKSHDFFMDGGTYVTVESADIIKNNLVGIRDTLNEVNADVLFLQEVDINSKRSYGINQAEFLADNFDGTSTFATNFLCDYIPFPLPQTIGKVNSGIFTLSKFNTISAHRIALPTPFSWPTRVAQLKRCLLVERVPIKDSEKQLVLINLHLEAYDDGIGKELQTKLLANLLKEEYAKGNYCIAGGDFNQVFPNVDPSLYPLVDDSHFQAGTLSSDILPKGWIFATDDSSPTCRLLNMPYDKLNPLTQYYVIDGFIVSENVSVDSIKTLDKGFEHSDHNPVVMKVTLK